MTKPLPVDIHGARKGLKSVVAHTVQNVSPELYPEVLYGLPLHNLQAMA